MIPKFPRKFFCLPVDRDKGLHHFDRDELAVMLTLQTPDQNWQTPDQVPEIAAVNGYPKGGMPLKNCRYSALDGMTKVVCDPVVLKCPLGGRDAGAIGPFRYVVIYNKTAGRLIGFQDRGGPDELAPGQILVINFGPNGVFSST
jgi:hypothetical protein